MINAQFAALLRDASPIAHLTRDDCPIYLHYNDDPRLAGDIHDPRFGRSVKMDRISVPCTLRMSSDFDQDRSTSRPPRFLSQVTAS